MSIHYEVAGSIATITIDRPENCNAMTYATLGEFIPRLIGPFAALRLLYSGDFLFAEEALRIGYVQQVIEPDQLLGAARAEGERYSLGSPFSQQRIKALVYASLGRDRAAHLEAHTVALAECFKSSDHAEGVASFLERRPANFTGK